MSLFIRTGNEAANFLSRDRTGGGGLGSRIFKLVLITLNTERTSCDYEALLGWNQIKTVLKLSRLCVTLFSGRCCSFLFQRLFAIPTPRLFAPPTLFPLLPRKVVPHVVIRLEVSASQGSFPPRLISVNEPRDRFIFIVLRR